MKTVLYVVENSDSAQYRYRCKNIAELLSSDNEWGIKIVVKGDLPSVKSCLSSVVLVVVERQTDKSGEIADFVHEAKRRGLKVFFDLDDLIFDYRYLPLLMWTTRSKNVFYWIGYFWGIRRIAKLVDGFIVTNEFLAQKIAQSFKKPVGIIRNSLNIEQIRVSEKCVKKKSENFVMGYFSGSPTHSRDLLMAWPGIERFLNKYDDAILWVVGYMKPTIKMRQFMKCGRIVMLPPVNYLDLQKKISEVDVNIAPLVINDFTNCKSELKFFEAGIVRTTTIASPTYSFCKIIRDGKNGFLAEREDWFNKLEFLYLHNFENQKIANEAKRDALKYYYGDEVLREIIGTYNALLDE